MIINPKNDEQWPIYSNKDDIKGNVSIIAKDNATFVHSGLSIELIGVIEGKIDGYRSEFIHLTKEIEAEGEINDRFSFTFSFKQISTPHESYEGKLIKVYYIVRVLLIKSTFQIKLAVDKQFVLLNPLQSPGLLAKTTMEIGFEGIISLEWIMNQNKFAIDDDINGAIKIISATQRLKSIELLLLKKETALNESDSVSVAIFEICDGHPFEGEYIPFRMFIDDYDLGPTMKNINNYSTVRYYLKIIVFTIEEQQFWKSQEIILWRRCFEKHNRLPDDDSITL